MRCREDLIVRGSRRGSYLRPYFALLGLSRWISIRTEYSATPPPWTSGVRTSPLVWQTVSTGLRRSMRQLCTRLRGATNLEGYLQG